MSLSDRSETMRCSASFLKSNYRMIKLCNNVPTGVTSRSNINIESDKRRGMGITDDSSEIARYKIHLQVPCVTWLQDN